MLRGFKSAGEPSLRHELAKSLHAGDIAVLRTFAFSPTLWQFVSFWLRAPLRCCDVLILVSQPDAEA